MPRFLSDAPHNIYRRRAFAIAAIVTGLFLILFASLPLLFRSDPFLSSRAPAYEEVSTEVFENLVHSSSFPLLIASIVFSIWGVSISASVRGPSRSPGTARVALTATASS